MEDFTTKIVDGNVRNADIPAVGPTADTVRVVPDEQVEGTVCHGADQTMPGSVAPEGGEIDKTRDNG
jgi:hypothetical protein